MPIPYGTWKINYLHSDIKDCHNILVTDKNKVWKNVHKICVNRREGKNKEEYYVHHCLYTQNISERIFKMLKLSICKEEKLVAERQGREETLYPVII